MSKSNVLSKTFSANSLLSFSELSPLCSSKSDKTSLYCSGDETARTLLLFFAAALNIDGPPISIVFVSSVSSTCFVTASSKG